MRAQSFSGENQVSWLSVPGDYKMSSNRSIYEGLRRPWSQYASEIYKVDTIVYDTYNVEYLELPPLRVVSIVNSIVTSSVPISLENTKTTRTRHRQYI